MVCVYLQGNDQKPGFLRWTPHGFKAKAWHTRCFPSKTPCHKGTSWGGNGMGLFPRKIAPRKPMRGDLLEPEMLQMGVAQN